MKKFIQYFELNKPYKFDVTDLTAIIYTICAIGIIMGYNMNVLFFCGATLATAFCWKARRLNLILLNVSMLVLNGYNVLMMIL